MARARSDLAFARSPLPEGAVYEDLCFHAQQAVEKGLKALLAMKDVEYPWLHDLGELVGLVRAHWPNLLSPNEELVELSPYAVEARYDDAWSPDPREARRALDLAEQLHALVARTVNAC
jgi:HEPN domain-containing protein